MKSVSNCFLVSLAFLLVSGHWWASVAFWASEGAISVGSKLQHLWWRTIVRSSRICNFFHHFWFFRGGSNMVAFRIRWTGNDRHYSTVFAISFSRPTAFCASQPFLLFHFCPSLLPFFHSFSIFPSFHPFPSSLFLFLTFSTVFQQLSCTFSYFPLFPAFFGQSDASPCDFFWPRWLDPTRERDMLWKMILLVSRHFEAHSKRVQITWKAKKGKVFNFHVIGTVSFFRWKSDVYEMMKIFRTLQKEAQKRTFLTRCREADLQSDTAVAHPVTIRNVKNTWLSPHLSLRLSFPSTSSLLELLTPSNSLGKYHEIDVDGDYGIPN